MTSKGVVSFLCVCHHCFFLSLSIFWLWSKNRPNGGSGQQVQVAKIQTGGKKTIMCEPESGEWGRGISFFLLPMCPGPPQQQNCNPTKQHEEACVAQAITTSGDQSLWVTGLGKGPCATPGI